MIYDLLYDIYMEERIRQAVNKNDEIAWKKKPA
jgi:hypothetical protein